MRVLLTREVTSRDATSTEAPAGGGKRIRYERQRGHASGRRADAKPIRTTTRLRQRVSRRHECRHERANTDGCLADTNADTKATTPTGLADTNADTNAPTPTGLADTNADTNAPTPTGATLTRTRQYQREPRRYEANTNARNTNGRLANTNADTNAPTPTAATLTRTRQHQREPRRHERANTNGCLADTNADTKAPTPTGLADTNADTNAPTPTGATLTRTRQHQRARRRYEANTNAPTHNGRHTPARLATTNPPPNETPQQ